MREATPNRATRRNEARKTGRGWARRWGDVNLDNHKAKIRERYEQCRQAQHAYIDAIVQHPFSPTRAAEAGTRALIEFWRSQRRTRPVARILAELTNPPAVRYFGGH